MRLPILIFESSLDGHRVRYVNYLVETLLADGHSLVVVLSETAEATVEYRSVLARHAKRVEFRFTIPPHPGRGWRNPWIRWLALYRQIVLVRPWKVVLPTADLLAQACGLFRFVWWRAAVRRAEFHATLLRLRLPRPEASGRAKLVGWANAGLLWIAPFARLTAIDEFAVATVPSGLRSALRLTYVAEPIELPAPGTQASARQRLVLPAAKKLVGVVGVLDARKGVGEFLVAVQSSRWPSDTTLVLAGPVSERWREKIANVSSVVPGRVLFFPGWLTEEQLLDYVTAFDVVGVLYFDHLDPSSIVVKAAACGTAVLASDQGWIGRFVHSRGLGQVIAAMPLESCPERMVETIEAMGQKATLPSTMPQWLDAYRPSLFARVIAGLE